VKETDNLWVHESFADAAVAMPPAAAAKIAEREAAWIDKVSCRLGPAGLPEKLAALVSHLIAGGEQVAALNLARSLLAVSPSERKARLSPKPRARIRDWDYQQVLAERVPHLVKAAPEPGMKLLCELLDSAVRSSLRREAECEPPEDLSWVWRHAIEDSAQDLSPTLIQGVRGLLVSALRDSAERVVEDRLLPITDVVRTLEAYQWLIFQRIALHAMRRFAEGARHLIAERLLDADRFTSPYDTCLLHEYALLLREQFSHLTAEQQGTILGWVERGPDLDRVKVRYEENIGQPFTTERADLYRKHWQQNRLALIRDDLPPSWRTHYDQLVAEIGEPEHPEFQSYSSGVKWGPTSPVKASEISSLTVEEIVQRIRSFHDTWTPSGDISKPTPDGLSRELSTAVSTKPERFVPEIDRFRQLSPTYVRGLISGFDQAARQSHPFNWAPVLDLCAWVVEQPRAGPGEPTRGVFDPFDVDRDWTRARSAVAQLLSTAFATEGHEPSLQLRHTVWKALFPLTADPEPDEKYESRYLEESGPAHISINTIRGEALHAVIRYALWVRRHLKEIGTGDARIAQGMDAMPEVRDVLDTHLDGNVDPSLAIRSVYGQWFPWLHLIDEKWAIANVRRIFPSDETLRRYWAAAWSVYVIFSTPYDNVFEVLRSEYARAIERLGDSDVNIERTERADERLAEHLVVLYARGCISLDEPGSLMVRFFERADAHLRAHAVGTAGWTLAGEESAIPREVIERLKMLWEWRLNATSIPPDVDRAERSAFSSWFTSRKFDDEWALAQLKTVLQLIGNLEGDFDVPKRLAELAPRYPMQTVECLRLMIEGVKEAWQISHWRDAPRRILQAAKQSGDAAAREMVDVVVNRLGARGLFEFRDLLS
jgi:hypothetical protein